MAEQQLAPFVRRFSPKLRQQLQATDLWQQLLEDAQGGVVFPAVRNNEMHFYHRGGRLLAFDTRGFRANVQYAIVPAEHRPGDVHENRLGELRVPKSFVAVYGAMKKRCAQYARGEAAQVARLYRNHSYARTGSPAPGPIVALDIEASLAGLDREEGGQDRIDLVLYRKSDKRLLFVEVKLLTNRQIREVGGQPPAVVGQIRDYAEQIKRRQSKEDGKIVAAYKDYVEVVNALFGSNLPPPESVMPNVPLLICGFDRMHQRNDLPGVKEVLAKHNVTCLSIGDAGGANEGTLQRWFKLAGG